MKNPVNSDHYASLLRLKQKERIPYFDDDLSSGSLPKKDDNKQEV